jgi:uncharacterized protein
MSARAEEGPFVDMALRRIVLRDNHDSQMIYLSEARGSRSFAITIGRGEAEEMRRVVAREQTARPLTHQLLLDALRAIGGLLARVEIHDLRHNTFYARLVLSVTGDDELHRVDARSSDAIALALRAGCPIQVAESVLQQVRLDLAPDTLPAPKAQGPVVDEPEEDEDELDLELELSPDDEDDEDDDDDDDEQDDEEEDDDEEGRGP